MKALLSQVTRTLPGRLFIFLFVITLTACGGGGGGTTTTTSPPSSDASLSALSISSGTLTPTFQSTQLSYTDTVGSSVSSVTVNATTSNSNASIKVNGISVASGLDSAAIALSLGSNTINVVVTAVDGTTTRTYTIDVTLPATNDATLSALSLTNASLSPTFSSATFNYNASVNFLVNSLRANATLSDPDASMTVNGSAASSGVNTAPLYLAEGGNTIDTVVTSADITMQNTYSVNVTRQAVSSFAQLPDTGAAEFGETGTDKFGVSIAISGDTMVVGAELNDVTGAGNEDGAAYVYVRNNGVWSSPQKLTAGADAASGDRFGHSVAIDGDTIVVGAYYQEDTGFNTGAAYVYVRSSGVWSLQQRLKATIPIGNGQFGISVAISGDSIAVGGNSLAGNGDAYVFVRNSGSWSQQQHLTASDAGSSDQFGKSVGIDGDTLVVGSPQHDSASLSNDGAAYVFTRSSGSWSEQKILYANNAVAGDNFGDTVALSGGTIAVGATSKDTSAGAVYVFTGAGSSWTQQPMLQASNKQAYDVFGFSLALSEGRLVVGADREDGDASSTVALPNENATDSGAVYVFLYDGANWSQQLYVKASDATTGDYFGSGVGIDGNTLVVGARAAPATTTATGAAYVFQ